jgi:predicted DCC family thiol-disulfide oxidoreductase YuxK
LTTCPILYDADCGFCRASLGLVLACDRRRQLRPVALQSEEGRRLLAGLTEEQRMGSWHLVGPDGEVHSAGSAFAPLAGVLGVAPVASLLERFPGEVESAYRYVADRRAPLGRRLPEAVKRRADRLIDSRS